MKGSFIFFMASAIILMLVIIVSNTGKSDGSKAIITSVHTGEIIISNNVSAPIYSAKYIITLENGTELIVDRKDYTLVKIKESSE